MSSTVISTKKLLIVPLLAVFLAMSLALAPKATPDVPVLSSLGAEQASAQISSGEWRWVWRTSTKWTCVAAGAAGVAAVAYYGSAPTTVAQAAGAGVAGVPPAAATTYVCNWVIMKIWEQIWVPIPVPPMPAPRIAIA